MNYQNRFVIFIDILGFKEKIITTINDKGDDVPESIKRISSAMKLTPLLFDDIDEVDKSRKVTQFSDSIVVSFEIEELDDLFLAIANTRLLILELVYKGFLCRGGIALGKLIHTKESIFGPALVEAYELESKAAIYPRVIVNENSLLNAFVVYIEKKKVYNENTITDFTEIKNLFSKDFDGNYYLDYFSRATTDIDYGFQIKYYQQLEAIIKEGLSSKSEATKVKYYWMREKYNQFVTAAKRATTLKTLKQNKEHELYEFCKSLKKI